MGALFKEATADSKWTQRDLANSDVFDYDLNDQVIAVKLNVPNPESTPAGNPTKSFTIGMATAAGLRLTAATPRAS